MLSIGIVWFLVLAGIAGIALYAKKHPDDQGTESRRRRSLNKKSRGHWSRRPDTFMVDSNLFLR